MPAIPPRQAINWDREPSRTDESQLGCRQGGASRYTCLSFFLFARLAEKHMTPKAKAAVAAILEPNESIADASHWADKVRGQMRHTAPWHYVDVPLDER
jgi:hypothetical protein